LLFDRRNNPVNLRSQNIVLRIDPTHRTVQRLGCIRQPFRRRHQLLHHFFAHASLLIDLALSQITATVGGLL
jgi:hypothetical protein